MSIREIKEKYGHIIMRLSNYYKYVFSLYGEDMNIQVNLTIGSGSSDDIYKLVLEEKQTLSDVIGWAANMSIYDTNKQEFIYDDYDV